MKLHIKYITSENKPIHDEPTPVLSVLVLTTKQGFNVGKAPALPGVHSVLREDA